MEFVGETLRAALEALAAAAPGWLTPLTGAGWAGRYGARIGSCRFPKGEDARERWAGQVGRDGFTLLDAVSAPQAPEWLRQVPAVGALRRAWDQQYRRDGEEVRWREGKDLPPGGQRLASPYDLDARYGVKRGTGWTGYEVHLTETCEPDLPHLIVNVETTGATTDDAEMTQVIHQRLAGRRLAPGEHAADAGYVSAGHILAARDDHGITLPGPVGAGTTQASRSGTGQEPPLAQDAFRIDWDARQVTCPQGAVSIFWSDQRKPSGTPVARVHFALADCGPCPLRPQCTKAANRRYGRSLSCDFLRRGLGQQVPQVPAVAALHRVRQCAPDGLPVGARAVTGDDLDAGVLAEPVLDDAGGASFQHVDAPAGLGVDEDSRVGKAASQREIVDLSGVQVVSCEVFAGEDVDDAVRSVVRRC
jgi:hypothetical protein